jgi:hypothetical protein
MSTKHPSNIEKRLAHLEAMDEVRGKKQDEVINKLDTLTTRFDRYEAKWGGVMMIVSALVAIVMVLKDEVKRLFSHG